MKAVLQRVKEASVTVDNIITGQISDGLLVYLGIAGDDTIKELDYIIKKICSLRIFSDENSKMNLSLIDKGFSLLVVSQFTLLAEVHKGNRPSFINAMNGEQAQELYLKFISKITNAGIKCETGRFGANMSVKSINDGPVTIIIESK
ncbi:MAG: D-tyrosyl-tRNA(Tyr) deacylase [Deltaproteobacteria bacterium]|nr:D-tyrosyl-tRNA(Tyr) deacylase [Deltaproteobacteria bacterium]